MAVVKRGKDHYGIPEGYAAYTTPELARENKYIRRKLEGFQDTKHENCKKIVEHRDNFKNASVMYSNLRPCELEGLKDLWLNVGDISPSQEFEKWMKSARQQWISDYLRSQKSGITTLKRPLCFCFKVRDKRQDLQIGLDIEIFSKYLNKTVYKCTTNSIGDVRTSSLFYFFAPYTIRWEDKESDEYTAKEIHDMNYFNIDANYTILPSPSVFENLSIAYFNQPTGLDIYPTSEKKYVWEEMTDKVQTTTEAGWPSNYFPARCYTPNNYLAREQTPDYKNRVIHVFFEKEDEYYKFKDSTVLFDFSDGGPSGDPEYCHIVGIYNTSKSLGIRYGKSYRPREDDKLYLTAPMWGVVEDEIEIAGVHPEDPWRGMWKVIHEEDGMWKVTVYGPPRVWRYPSICELFGYTYEYCVAHRIYKFDAAQNLWLEGSIPKADSKIAATTFSSKGEVIFLLEDKTIYYTGLFLDDAEIHEWENGPYISDIEAITGPYPSFIAGGGQLY